MNDFRQKLIGRHSESLRQQNQSRHGRRLASPFETAHRYFRAAYGDGKLHLRHPRLFATGTEGLGKRPVEVR